MINVRFGWVSLKYDCLIYQVLSDVESSDFSRFSIALVCAYFVLGTNFFRVIAEKPLRRMQETMALVHGFAYITF